MGAASFRMAREREAARLAAEAAAATPEQPGQAAEVDEPAEADPEPTAAPVAKPKPKTATR